MKIRVPFAWYWYGDKEFGEPEVEMGTIADANPTPPPQAVEEAERRARIDAEDHNRMHPPPPSMRDQIKKLEQRIDSTSRMASSAFDAAYPQGR